MIFGCFLQSFKTNFSVLSLKNISGFSDYCLASLMWRVFSGEWIATNQMCSIRYRNYRGSVYLVITLYSRTILQLNILCEIVAASRCRYAKSLGNDLRFVCCTTNTQIILSVTSMLFRLTISILFWLVWVEWMAIFGYSFSPPPSP